jgi:hypothetical protein
VKTLCRCCEPPPGLDTELSNRPSLSAIAYRIGTFARFRAAMLDEIADHPELALLTTRDSDDYGITVLEGWAAIADVLTFYQERYANEAFLRTATFSDSVARVAALIGYRPRPGLAARAWLAFTLDQEGPVRIRAGQKVQSVPGPDEQPQIYETLADVLAYQGLNATRIFGAPATINPHAVGASAVLLDLLDGPQIAAPLGPDQKVVLFNFTDVVGIGVQAAAAVQAAVAAPAFVTGAQRFLQGGGQGTAQLQLQTSLETEAIAAESLAFEGVQAGLGASELAGVQLFEDFLFEGTGSVSIFIPPPPEPVEEKKIAAVEVRDHREVLTWDQPIQKSGWTGATRAFRFRRKLRVFGHNAPRTYVQPAPDPNNPNDATKIIWNLVTRTNNGLSASNLLHLDGRHEDLQVGQQLLVSDTGFGGKNTLVRIRDVDQVQATHEPLSDTVTRLRLDRTLPAAGDRSTVVVYELVGDQLRFSTVGYGPVIAGDAVYLPGVARLVGDELGVEVGRRIERAAFKPGHVLLPSLIEEGRTLLLADAAGEPIVVTVREPPTVQPASADEGDACHLRILVDSEAAWSLDAESALLHGNVAEASHGETVRDELIGQGDASRTFQRFALKKKPLTYLPAPVAAGAASTLQLSVGGIRWNEVAELYGQAPDAAVAELRHDADGNAIVQAGDGVFGAPLPTGAEVRATYRIGSGLAGRVAAESLTTLLQRPPGVTEVRNPLAAEGGADAETLETARLNAPRGVRTFGRIVSIQDFADQVTLSGEVAKALAVPVWDGLDQGIHLTVAAQGGALFSPTALADLGANLESVRDPNHRLRLDNYRPVFIEVRGGIGVLPDADAEQVLADARQAVLDALSFDAVSLGQAVNLSDLYRVLQDVPGVRFVDIDRFLFKLSQFGGIWSILIELWRRGVLGPGWSVDPVQSRLRIFAARPDPAQPGSVLPAELAAIELPDEDVTLELREA